MATKTATTKTTGTKGTAKTKAAPKTTKAVVLFQKSKETKGTFAYKAVNSKGTPLTAEETSCSQIYVTKKGFASGPEFLKVTIEEISALPKGDAQDDTDGDEE